VLTITRNEAPLLLLVAEADLRCPPIHSEIAFTALRMAGKPAEMVRYPGEYHVMYVDGRPDRRIDRLERILTWFGRHL
jgi:dipeptidyl aminopeptidase/acylaminoacyl peptidase